MTEPALLFFAKYIETELGIVYSEHNYFQLQRRLEEIANAQNCSIPELHAQAQSGISDGLKRLLLDTATNNETSFFRDPRVFKAIESAVLPSFPNGVHLKVWSAASSTGQEALSIAMLIQEFAEKRSVPIEFSILASDISERVLEIAKKATYSSLEVSRGLAPTHLEKYFRKNDQDKWVAASSLTKHIEYKKMNLKSPFTSLDKFHIIFLRNVLIYQSLEGKKEILSRIFKQLEPNGFLVLGTGETLIGIPTEFEQIECEGTILYRGRSKAAAA